VSTRSEAIVGRERELALLSRFLSDREALPGGLLIVGDPGVGKTTLWDEGVAMGEAAGYRILVCRPASAEAQLSFAALSDLLLAELDEVVPFLPLPQRRALELALLLREADDRPPDPHAIAAAALNAVRALARERPLLLAIDDAQWLDPPSAAALGYAVRRLRAEPVAVMASSRTEVSALPPLDLDRALRPGRLERIEVGPLSFGALHRLLRERTGRSLNCPSLRRIYDTSGGNPFYALELARAMDGAGGPAPGEPLRLSASLEELLGRRLSVFDAATLDALFVAAAAFQPTLALVAAVLEAPAGPILAPAISAGIVRTDGRHIRFSHPLLASASYAQPDDDRRRHWHARLAEVSTDIEERARHRGLSTRGQDPALAALLHDAGRRAQARGAPTAAAALFEQAIAMTPPDQGEARVARIVDAGRVLLMTGDRRRARLLLEEADTVLGEGPLRSEALLLRAQLAVDEVRAIDRVPALIEQSLHEAGSDGRRRAEALVLREFWEGNLGRYDLALESSRAAAALAEQTGDGQLLTRALTRLAFNEVVLGLANEDPVAQFSRAIELHKRHPIDPYTAPPSMLAYCLMAAGRVDEARPHLVGQVERARDEGNDDAWAGLSLHLAELEWLAGHWTGALAHARMGLEVSEQVASRQTFGAGLSLVALIEASLGDAETARAHATDGFNLCVEIGDSEFSLHNRYALGFLEGPRTPRWLLGRTGDRGQQAHLVHRRRDRGAGPARRAGGGERARGRARTARPAAAPADAYCNGSAVPGAPPGCEWRSGSRDRAHRAGACYVRRPRPALRAGAHAAGPRRGPSAGEAQARRARGARGGLGALR
jgi:tetratricopeptide (TPR) repeat protein